eukprot:8178018-Ditylum_brightwellii.AAC.1
MNGDPSFSSSLATFAGDNHKCSGRERGSGQRYKDRGKEPSACDHHHCDCCEHNHQNRSSSDSNASGGGSHCNHNDYVQQQQQRRASTMVGNKSHNTASNEALF